MQKKENRICKENDIVMTKTQVVRGIWHTAYIHMQYKRKKEIRKERKKGKNGYNRVMDMKNKISYSEGFSMTEDEEAKWNEKNVKRPRELRERLIREYQEEGRMKTEKVRFRKTKGQTTLKKFTRVKE